MILYHIFKSLHKAINKIMATIIKLNKNKVEIIISKLFLLFNIRIIRKSFLLLNIIIIAVF